MLAPVYIVGSSLISSLNEATGESTLTTIPVSVTGQRVDIPFKAIPSISLDNNAQRLFEITKAVIEKALQQADWEITTLSECAIFIGSTSYNMYANELIYQQQHADELAFLPVYEMTNYIHTLIPNAQLFTFNTACTSSANAMIYAGKMLRAKKIKKALVLGLEFYNQTTLLGFHSLGLISKSQLMQPFGLHRDGLILGEACSAVALSLDQPRTPCLRFVAGATLNDNHSITAANPDGSGVASVLNQAIHNAAISKHEIAGIKLHGTASLANDETEKAGLQSVFGDKLPNTCVLKPFLGHTLGACGTNELVLLERYLLKQQWPEPVTYALDQHLMVNLDQVNTKAQDGYYLLNYFGFGGSNTALILQKD